MYLNMLNTAGLESLLSVKLQYISAHGDIIFLGGMTSVLTENYVSSSRYNPPSLGQNKILHPLPTRSCLR